MTVPALPALSSRMCLSDGQRRAPQERGGLLRRKPPGKAKSKLGPAVSRARTPQSGQYGAAEAPRPPLHPFPATAAGAQAAAGGERHAGGAAAAADADAGAGGAAGGLGAAPGPGRAAGGRGRGGRGRGGRGRGRGRGRAAQPGRPPAAALPPVPQPPPAGGARVGAAPPAALDPGAGAPPAARAAHAPAGWPGGTPLPACRLGPGDAALQRGGAAASAPAAAGRKRAREQLEAPGGSGDARGPAALQQHSAPAVESPASAQSEPVFLLRRARSELPRRCGWGLSAWISSAPSASSNALKGFVRGCTVAPALSVSAPVVRMWTAAACEFTWF